MPQKDTRIFQSVSKFIWPRITVTNDDKVCQNRGTFVCTYPLSLMNGYAAIRDPAFRFRSRYFVLYIFFAKRL